MKDKIGYDPQQNLIVGIKGLCKYHFYNVARVISYIAIISVSIFHYDIFGFFFKTSESVNFSFILNIVIIVIPTFIHLVLETRKKLSVSSNIIRDSWYYRIMIIMLISVELVFFAIHWYEMAYHTYEIKISEIVKNQFSIALILSIFWLPFSEGNTFHRNELREWICARDKYLNEFESKK